MSLKLLIILAVTAVLSWWLSGYDSKVTGEDKTGDLARRSIRCSVTLLVVGIGSSSLLNGGVFFFIITLPLAILWAGCLSELCSRGFHALVDSPDHREFDPNQASRDLDRLARLVHQGRYEEALVSCQRLTESGEVSALAMEAMLFRLYGEMFGPEQIANSPSLVQVQQLREQRRLDEAEGKLKSLLDREPANLPAAVTLMRIYTQDRSQPERATALLDKLSHQPRLPPGFVQYVRHSIDEWSGVAPSIVQTSEGVESLLVVHNAAPAAPSPQAPPDASIDELLAAGHLATAIEGLEAKIRQQPNDFDLRLKLAEAHGYYCANLNQARKIVEKIDADPAFDARQRQLAKAKLEEWRAHWRR